MISCCSLRRCYNSSLQLHPIVSNLPHVQFLLRFVFFTICLDCFVGPVLLGSPEYSFLCACFFSRGIDALLLIHLPSPTLPLPTLPYVVYFSWTASFRTSWLLTHNCTSVFRLPKLTVSNALGFLHIHSFDVFSIQQKLLWTCHLSCVVGIQCYRNRVRRCSGHNYWDVRQHFRYIWEHNCIFCLFLSFLWVLFCLVGIGEWHSIKWNLSFTPP